VADSTHGYSGAAVVGTLALAIGAVLFIGGLRERRDARTLRAEGLVAEATVVDTAVDQQVQQVGGMFSTRYGQRVTFDFEDLHGGRHSTTMTFSTEVYSIGDSVRVAYDPGAPEHADVLDLCTGWFSCDQMSVVPMAIGTLVCVFGAALVLAELPWPRTTPPGQGEPPRSSRRRRERQPLS
jgi:hypothetical protein